MISKNKIKILKSLKQKKKREELGLFLIEGAKNIIEFLESDFVIENILITKDFLYKNKELLKNKNYEVCSEKELENIGTLKTNSDGIMCVKQKENKYLEKEKNELVLVLDNISDPGNLGTIIRICDWYGIKKIIIGKKSVEVYNPKVVSSTMGSLKNIDFFYTEIKEYLKCKKDENIIGTYLEGEDIHKIGKIKDGAYIIIGNESQGINKNLEDYITKKVTIPRFGKAESLNAGVATGIILDNLKN